MDAVYAVFCVCEWLFVACFVDVADIWCHVKAMFSGTDVKDVEVLDEAVTDLRVPENSPSLTTGS